MDYSGIVIIAYVNVVDSTDCLCVCRSAICVVVARFLVAVCDSHLCVCPRIEGDKGCLDARVLLRVWSIQAQDHFNFDSVHSVQSTDLGWTHKPCHILVIRFGPSQAGFDILGQAMFDILRWCIWRERNDWNFKDRKRSMED